MNHELGVGATLDKTLLSAGLGKEQQCFLCSFTDQRLTDGSMFVGEDGQGPVEQVTRYWNANAQNVDVDRLSRDCHALLLRILSEFAPLDSLGETQPDEGGGAGTATNPAHRSALEGVTPEAIKRHFVLCMTTGNARLNALRASFRHVAQLEHACANSMYTKCKKTGKAKPDLAMSALLLKANTALLKTNQLINAAEGRPR